jgi:endonuclease YncB( thermonuclease family)
LKKKIILLSLFIIACRIVSSQSEENFLPIEDVGLKVDSPVLVETQLFGKVRLLGITEISQDNKYYQAAFNYVKERVEEQKILLDVDGTAPTDELGHIRAVVYYRKDQRWVNLNIEMVQLGYAKVMPIANSQIDPKAWFEYEKQARDQRLGIWEDFKPGELPKE